MIKPMKTLKDKLEEKKVLQEAMTKVDDKIDELVGDKKVKISRKKLPETN